MKQKRLLQTQRSTVVQPSVPTVNLHPTKTEARSLRDEIARKAYLIYVRQGCQDGHDVQHWLEAESQTISADDPGARGA